MYARGIWAQNVAIVNTKSYNTGFGACDLAYGPAEPFSALRFHRTTRAAANPLSRRATAARPSSTPPSTPPRRPVFSCRTMPCRAMPGHAGQPRAGVPARQPRGPHPLHHAHRRTPPGRPVRGEGAPDNARQTLYLGGAKRHLVGRRHIRRYISGRRSRPWATGATRA